MMLEKDLSARTEAVLLATIVRSMVGTMAGPIIAMLYLFYFMFQCYPFKLVLFHLCVISES